LPAQAIVLTGNSNTITAGDIYPSATDNSDFGTALSKTFTIQNPGTSALVVSGFSNSHPSEFNIPTTTPFTVAPSSSANFVVNYTGTLTTSIRSSTITIHNNSCANPNFVFAVNAGDRQLYVATTGDSKIAKVRNDVAYTCPSWLTIPGASTVVVISNSNGRIFYYDGTSNIGIANMNGSVINPSFVTGVSNITGMAITNNVYGGEVLYFSRGGASGGISIAETSFSTTGSVGFVSGNIRDVALYPQEQNVYYITSGSNVISMFKDYHGQNNWSANYPSFITGCNSPTGKALT